MPRVCTNCPSIQTVWPAWPLRLDDVINKLLKRLLVSFKPIVNSLEVMDHFNFDTWRKLDFCSRDTNTLEPTLFVPKTMLHSDFCDSCWPAFASFYRMAGSMNVEHWTEASEQICRHDLLPGLALTRCCQREENCDTESGVSMATFTCQEERETISGVWSVDTEWRSIKQGKLSRQLPDDVWLRISLTGSRFLSSRLWRHPESCSEWHIDTRIKT